MTLFGMFMIFVPIESASWINAVWLILTLLGFNLFSSLYNVPYNALSAELVTDDKRRVFFYTISTLLFVIGSALAFTTPFLKGFLVSSGLSELWAWRVSFIIFGVIGGVAAAIPAFKIKENDYIERKPCFVPLFESFKATFKYNNFTILVIAYLIMWIGFAFFNYSLMYYITILLGLKDTFSTIVMVISITVGIASYPLVNILAKKFGKKPLLLCAAVAYIIIYGTISLYNVIVPVIGGEVFAILIGVLIGMPISITNIIPSAAFADMAQYDTIVTGINRAGMFGAARNFMNNLSQSIVAFILPLTISLGSPEGHATEKGTQISAIVPTVMIAFSLIFYVLYNDKEVVGTIKKYNEDLALKTTQGEISEQQ
jgi:GPH family glycoside/pentoside/hexuronide:cation symporter